MKRGITVVIADTRSDPRSKDGSAALEAISARAFVNMPLTEQGGLVALLYLNNATARQWPQDELDFVREVAEHTRLAVARRVAERELADLADTGTAGRGRTRELLQAEEALRQPRRWRRWDS